MESFEFLGARYNRPEQIMSGPVQAFKAQNAVTGNPVFIHRVSTTEAPLEQAAILKLLTTALVKSSDAKRLVLDFGEEYGYWYVVTESEPQCAALRAWLQLQVDTANVRSGAASASLPLPPADPGEFSRYVLARSQNGYPPPATPPTRPVTGEFTNFFSDTTSKPAPPPIEAQAAEFIKVISPPDEVKPPAVVEAAAPPVIAAKPEPPIETAPEDPEPIITIPQHVNIRPPDDLKFLAPRKKSGGSNKAMATFFVVLVVLALAVMGVMMFLVQNK
jgi:hypothetical protein